jgi:uncharacterized glyoxalase superfamily protein PhnB
MKIPAGHQTVMPYLIVPDGKGFLDFAKKVFHAKVTHEEYLDDGNLRHGEIQIGNSTIMVSNSRKEWVPEPAGLFIYVENADDTYQMALDSGASSVMPPANQPYGRSGGVKDPFGNTWWITSL